MATKIVVGPIKKGLSKFYLPFAIDNDSFPTMINAYQWRGRIKRKRGTSLLDRLTRFFDSTNVSYSSTSTIVLDGSGAGNILTGFSLQANGNIQPGTVTLTASGGPTVYTDPTMDGYLTPTGTSGPNTINYSTGDILIPAQAGNTVSSTFLYYPSLPVMGLEDRNLRPTQNPGTVAFDTVYSYEIDTADPYDSRDVSFYKNLATGTYPGYIQKTNWSPVKWNGQDYQQFWTVNYQGALWAINGITVPFTTTNIGMQFKPITGVVINAAGPPALATLTIVAHGLTRGDFIFVNEVGGVTGINFQTGYVVSADPQAANTVQVEFPNATLGGAYTSGGIAQYLTRSADPTKDCIRWYDGDPTDGNPTTPSFSLGNGWVNFMPPLSQGSYSIADLPPRQYYLVGARAIVPFKDRLLFFGAVVQASTGDPFYLQDTVIYSQNGTPYYTCSFTGDPVAITTTFTSILVPVNQTAIAAAFYEDVTGFGGFLEAGIAQAINSVSINEDVLIIGFKNIQTKLVYSGNDIIPFNFFFINSELGSSSMFSAINLDKGVITKGDRGYIMTTQVETSRIDVEIPDQVFQVNLTANGNERFCAQRDFINEWIYFTYPANETNASIVKFPNQTLQYNYREQTWSILNECFTTYGQFKRRTGFIWSTVYRTYGSWAEWNDSWDSGNTTLEQPELIAGNQQGFVFFRDEGTGEKESLAIQSFSGNTVTSPDHCLSENDYIYITGALGTVGTLVNGKIFQIYSVTQNTFKINPSIASGTYFGNGVIRRLYRPYIQTKQFPVAWELGRKTRIGTQQYLLSTTDKSQITLLIFLSQDSTNPYNDGSIVPDNSNLLNNGLIYSTVLYTCPESTNLGLTPANTNLQMPTAPNQSQIWHRINTSLLGDTVQLGFTLSDTQMTDVDEAGNFISQDAEIEIHGFIIDVSPSSLLA